MSDNTRDQGEETRVSHAGFFRDAPVDILRGIAITPMIMANLTPVLLLPDAPGWYRFLSSLAAPLFILLAGMMIALSQTGKGRRFSYIAIRGGMVILAGALLQIFAPRFVPFLDMDVLYLIGISLPIAYLYLCLPERKRWLIILAILGIAPILRLTIGYNLDSVEIPTISFFGPTVISKSLPAIADIVRLWFIDGWFPIFPWLSVSLFGAELGMYRWGQGAVKSFLPGKEGLTALVVLIAGGLLWVLSPGLSSVRMRYVELFYPPITGFLIFCTGVALMLFTLLDRLPPAHYFLMDPLRAMGECSLAIYLLHYAIILRLIEPLHAGLPMPEYLSIYLLLLLAMIGVAYGLRYVRIAWKKQPFVVRFLIGG